MKLQAVPNAGHAHDWTRSIGLRIPNAALTASLPKRSASRRNRIWEIHAAMHCSIVGTCLTGGELRSLLRRCGAAPDARATDHALHEIAVAAAGRHDEISKQIQKALDERHRAAIARFGGAASVDELTRLWDEAVQGGDIPGAYWAVLTHPLCEQGLARHAFGDVHMFSHLLGSASQVALQKLRRLENERAELEDKLRRQQDQLRDAVVSRDSRIRDLNIALLVKAERDTNKDAAPQPELSALNCLVTDLRKQLDGETRRRGRAEKKLQDASAAASSQAQDRAALAGEISSLRDELAAAESALAAFSTGADQLPAHHDLAGTVVLYVGGRPRQAAQMKLLVEQAHGQFLHHDGGIEERSDLLPGLVSRADVALFPVDCISHAAALSLKRLCRQAGKPFVPLRSSGLSTFLHALTTLNVEVAVASA